MKKMTQSLFAAVLASVMVLPSNAAAVTAAALPVEEPVVVNEAKADDITSEELTAAILRFKEVFGETDKYSEFSHAYSTYQNLKVFDMSWSNANESVNASITETGLITSYSYSKTKASASRFIIPEISKDEALTAALEWVADITPEYLSYVSDSFANISYSRYAGRYNVMLYGNINGRRIEDTSISVRISGDGTLLSYNCTSMPYNMLPAADNGLRLIGEEAAAAKLTEALPFKLVYHSFHNYNDELGRSEATVKLVYIPNADYRETVVNAVTGDVLKIVYPASIMTGNGMYADAVVTEEAASEAPAAAADKLTESELGAVEIQDSFMTIDELKNMLLELAVFDFDDAYELASSNVSKSYDAYTGKESYTRTAVWKKIDEDGKTIRANLTCDAETGEIFSFYRTNYDLHSYDEWQNTTDVLEKKAASAFEKLSSYSVEYKASEYDYTENTYRTTFTLQYNRYKDNIPVESDYASFTLDPNSGLVLRYSINRIHAELQSSSFAMTAVQAARSYYETLGLEPYYIAAGEITDDELVYVENTIDSTEKLVIPVYSLEYYCYIDAVTGQLINYSAEEYTKPETTYYSRDYFSDISGHSYEKAVKLLFNMGYIDGTSEFRPDDAVTEEEFIEMASSILGYYEMGENSEQTLTRTQAAKIVVTALGHEEIASLKGIYKLPFEISGSVDDEDIGYVAIACALGLFDGIGESFDADAALTRGEAASVMQAYILQAANE